MSRQKANKSKPARITLTAVSQQVGTGTEWEPLLAEMTDFGFTESASAQDALIKTNGNIKAAVKMLLHTCYSKNV